MSSQKVRIIAGGRLIIPASMRRELGLTTGDTVVLDIAGGEPRVRSLPQAIARAQAVLRRPAPDDISLADELIEDRRREAERE